MRKQIQKVGRENEPMTHRKRWKWVRDLERKKKQLLPAHVDMQKISPPLTDVF